MGSSFVGSELWLQQPRWLKWRQCAKVLIPIQLQTRADENHRAPTSSGQYHWVAMLAPKSQAVFLSWVTGWLAIIGWWANTAAGVFFGATVTQGLLVLNYPNYVFERWHGTLLMFAALAACVMINSIGAKLLPRVEGLILILHVMGFFAVLIPLVYLAPHNNAEFVFGSFINSSGWSNPGLTWLIGLIGTNLPFIGTKTSSECWKQLFNKHSCRL
jgi:amino acid transporter